MGFWSKIGRVPGHVAEFDGFDGFDGTHSTLSLYYAPVKKNGRETVARVGTRLNVEIRRQKGYHWTPLSELYSMVIFNSKKDEKNLNAKNHMSKLSMV